MGSRSFAGFSARPSPWGYNWTTENISTDYRPISDSPQNSPASTTTTSSPEPQMMPNQYANMPAALLTSLKRDKKPFTYTPGGVNLSEVLNARLQKRIERKKRYTEQKLSEQTSYPSDNLPKFEPPKQVIVLPTYNSPLDMYSMENALEALEVQAGLVANDRSLSSPVRSATLPRNHRFEEKDLDSERGVAQSKAFRVLQIITDTEADPSQRGRNSPVHRDEMRFTGLRDSKAIPSKFFHTLQKMTGTDEEEEEEYHSSPSSTIRIGASKPQMFENKPTNPSFQATPTPAPAKPAFHQQPTGKSHQKTVTFQEPTFSSSLKRPAAFLPQSGGDPMSRVRSVQFLANGTKKGLNPIGGTDF